MTFTSERQVNEWRRVINDRRKDSWANKSITTRRSEGLTGTAFKWLKEDFMTWRTTL